jgi:hypothetical protein
MLVNAMGLLDLIAGLALYEGGGAASVLSVILMLKGFLGLISVE